MTIHPGYVAGFRVRTIGFCGPAGAGKSTAAEHLVQRWHFSRLRFAGPLKAMMLALGLDAEQVDGARKEEPCDLLCGKTPRQAMQLLGTEWGRDLIGGDFWLSAWRAAVDRLPAVSIAGEAGPVRLVVVDDVRFPNEADAIRARGGLIVRIARTGAASASGAAHVSEQHAIMPDAIVNNDGDLREFLASIDNFARSLRVE